MQTYGERDLRRNNWRMMKPLIGKAFKLPVVNPALHFLGRAVLPPAVLHRLPVAGRHVRFETRTAGPITLLDPGSDIVAKDIYWGKGRPTAPADGHILDKVESLARQASTFLDIGAYSGLFAMIAAKANSGLKAITYEILPESHVLIVSNVIENDLVGQVDTRLRGLSDAPGSLTMPIRSVSFTHPTSLSIESAFESGVNIPVTTLDRDLPEIDGPLLIKIDVETFEWQVLQGAAETIRRHRPDMICEFLPESEHHREVQDMLSPLGYRFYVALDSGFEERPSIVPDPSGMNWLPSTRPA
jgi:FkbM family methyltransferase